MRITLERAVLVSALRLIGSVVESRDTIPILRNVLLTAGCDKLSITATNLDMLFTTQVPARVEEAGTITVVESILKSIAAKANPKDEITLALDPEKGQLTVRSGRTRWSLHTLPADDFPSFDRKDDEAVTYTINSKDVIKLFGTTEFAISTEEARYYLNGIYLHLFGTGNNSMLRAVSTDGRRMAIADVGLPAGAENIPGVIVPRKTVSEAVKLAATAETVEITVSPAGITFRVGSTVLISKLIDGQFPDYQRVMPAGNDKILTVNRKDLINSLERVMAITSERGRAVKFVLNEGKVILEMVNPDSGAATEEIEVAFDHEGFDIGFNGRYAVEILNAMETETIEMRLSNSILPTLFAPVGDKSTQFVLMPMRC